MTESDIRVSRIDPLVKGICRCTDASFKTECITKTDGTKQGSQDYGIFRISNFHAMLMIIWEIKKEKEIPKNAIAQTIGYFIASNVITEISDNPNKLKPALGFVTSQSECRLIFFPFKSAENKPCLDALVSKAFPLIEDSINNDFLV